MYDLRAGDQVYITLDQWNAKGAAGRDALKASTTKLYVVNYNGYSAKAGQMFEYHSAQTFPMTNVDYDLAGLPRPGATTTGTAGAAQSDVVTKPTAGFWDWLAKTGVSIVGGTSGIGNPVAPAPTVVAPAVSFNYVPVLAIAGAVVLLGFVLPKLQRGR